MKLTYNKQTTQEAQIDLELPAFFESYGAFAMIKEDGLIVKVGKSFIFTIDKVLPASYSRDLGEILTTWKPVAAHQFEEALSAMIDIAKAQLPELATV